MCPGIPGVAAVRTTGVSGLTEAVCAPLASLAGCASVHITARAASTSKEDTSKNKTRITAWSIT